MNSMCGAMGYVTTEVHKDEIFAGDVIIHDEKMRTVCVKDINNDHFMGITIFGDSYHSGHKLVKRVTFIPKGVQHEIYSVY